MRSGAYTLGPGLCVVLGGLILLKKRKLCSPLSGAHNVRYELRSIRRRQLSLYVGAPSDYAERLCYCRAARHVHWAQRSLVVPAPEHQVRTCPLFEGLVSRVERHPHVQDDDLQLFLVNKPNLKLPFRGVCGGTLADPPVHYLAPYFAPTPPPALPEQAGDGPGDRADDREDPDRDHIGAHPPTTRLNHDRGYGVHQLPNHLLHHGLCTLS